MDPDFWRAAWQGRRIKFHEGKPNSFLAAHASVLANSKRILVPLCGKTEDLAYLAAQGHEVVGIELVEDAVREFFAEHSVTPTVTAHPHVTSYVAGPIALFAGDFFAVMGSDVGAINGIYDRAALVALPPALRRRYVMHLHALAPGAHHELLVSFDDPQSGPEGPPFSVPESEIRELYCDATIELLDSAPELQDFPGRKLRERCYAITLR